MSLSNILLSNNPVTPQPWTNLTCSSLTCNSLKSGSVVSLSKSSTVVKYTNNLNGGSTYTIPSAAGSSVRLSFDALATYPPEALPTATPGFINTIDGVSIFTESPTLNTVKLTNPGFYSFYSQIIYQLSAAYGTSRCISLLITIDIDGVTSTYRGDGTLPEYNATANLNNVGFINVSGVFYVPPGASSINITAFAARPVGIESNINSVITLTFNNLSSYLLLTQN